MDFYEKMLGIQRPVKSEIVSKKRHVDLTESTLPLIIENGSHISVRCFVCRDL